MAFISFSEEHGGINPSELRQSGISPADLIDFSVNSNPFGPSPRVLEAIRTVDISTYPDRHCFELTEALAQTNQLTSQHILVGNGTSELIWLIAHAFLKPGDCVVIAGPTFGEYQRAASTLGAHVSEVRAQPPDFLPPLEQVVSSILKERPRLVFLCNPNNPTGKSLDPESIEKLIQTCGSTTILIIDEAYRAFSNGDFFVGQQRENCLILRSMTKDFALAGIRLGYLFGKPELIERMRQFQPAWSVNSYAQAAGIAALTDIDYYKNTLLELYKLKDDFFFQLKISGYSIVLSDTHFCLVHAGGPARDLRMRLLKSCLQVRDCTSFGLPEYIRVSTQKESDNLKLLEALRFNRKE